MKSRALHHAVAIALLAAAPIAFAQTGSAQSGNHDTAASSTAPHADHAPMAHKATHHASGARTHPRTSTASRSGGGSGNAEYDAALRRCVEMNGDGRERCLDEAITRYGS